MPSSRAGAWTLLALIGAACSAKSSPSDQEDPGAPPPVTSQEDASTSPPDASPSPPDAGPVDDAPAAPDAAEGGVTRPAGPFWSADLSAFALDEASRASDGTLEITAGGGHAATDPYGPNGYHGKNYYNGGAYTFAAVTSPEHVFPKPFTSTTVSFEAATPAGTWVNVKAQARIAGRWTKEYSLGIWAFDYGTVSRHSVDGQADADGDVATDTLTLKAKADALKVTVVLFTAKSGVTPKLRAVSAIATDTSAPLPSDTVDESVWGKVLAVPQRSQMIYAGGGEVWCSPTSTSMLLAYWSTKLQKPELVETVPTAADHCYDWLYAGTGNWPFNTAHGSGMGGAGALHGFVTRLSSFAEVERLVKADVPVAISVAYAAGELHGSPIPSTDGHLIVVRGFASNGDVVCNDPAFPSDAQVKATYDRAELDKAWRKSDGTTYVLYPTGTELPIDPLGAF